jgi:hypothetical protein
MRWILRAFTTIMLVALMAQPVSAALTNLIIIDTQGSPVPDITISLNWGNGKTTTLTTDSTGRLQGEVPNGWHFCSIWSGGDHVGSGACIFAGNKNSLTQSSGTGKSATSETSIQDSNRISPTPTTAEKAASSAVNIVEEFDWAGFAAFLEIFGRPMSSREIMVYEAGGFGVLMADLFGLTGDGGADGDGGDGSN